MSTATTTAPTYYARKAGNFFYELRQTRFKTLFEAGTDHPHDVCAIGRSVEELEGMYEKYLSGGVDWSATREQLAPGCYFDGAHGQECNDNRVLALAKQYGWVDAEEGLGRVDHLEEIEETDPDELRGYAVQEAIEYLQDYIPAGHTIGWENGGDFGVWPDEEEES